MTVGMLIAAGVVGWLTLLGLALALCRAAAVQDTQRYRRTPAPPPSRDIRNEGLEPPQNPAAFARPHADPAGRHGGG